MHRKRCPTCGQPVGPWEPSKVCWKCKQPIKKGHKWRFVNSRAQHRNCNDPDSYKVPE